MPDLPMQPCQSAGCKNLSQAEYCEEHKADANRTKGGYSGKRYGYEWDRLSRLIRKREPVCRACKVRAARCVDHIVPKSSGGTDDPKNLQPLCTGCHDEKTKLDRIRYR